LTISNIGILGGLGQIGQAIAEFYSNPLIEDKTIKEFGETRIHILHICIPYSEKFIEICQSYIAQNDPQLVFIHSTVPVGTTAELNAHSNFRCLHTPIRGVHPNLHEGIKTFVQYVGFDLEPTGLAAKDHLAGLGLKVCLVRNSRNTEALKLWDTTQYGRMIELNKEIHKYCENNGLDFDIIYTHANITYNEGYLKLGRPEVIRPFLKYMPGQIGGHCIIPNCRLLDSPTAKDIIRKNLDYA